MKKIQEVLISSGFDQSIKTLKLNVWQGGREWMRLTPSISIMSDDTTAVRVTISYSQIKRTKFFKQGEGIEVKILGWFFGSISNHLGVTLNKWRDYV